MRISFICEAGGLAGFADLYFQRLKQKVKIPSSCYWYKILEHGRGCVWFASLFYGSKDQVTSSPVVLSVGVVPGGRFKISYDMKGESEFGSKVLFCSTWGEVEDTIFKALMARERNDLVLSKRRAVLSPLIERLDGVWGRVDVDGYEFSHRTQDAVAHKKTLWSHLYRVNSLKWSQVAEESLGSAGSAFLVISVNTHSVVKNPLVLSLDGGSVGYGSFYPTVAQFNKLLDLGADSFGARAPRDGYAPAVVDDFVVSTIASRMRDLLSGIKLDQGSLLSRSYQSGICLFNIWCLLHVALTGEHVELMIPSSDPQVLGVPASFGAKSVRTDFGSVVVRPVRVSPLGYYSFKSWDGGAVVRCEVFSDGFSDAGEYWEAMKPPGRYLRLKDDGWYLWSKVPADSSGLRPDYDSFLTMEFNASLFKDGDRLAEHIDDVVGEVLAGYVRASEIAAEIIDLAGRTSNIEIARRLLNDYRSFVKLVGHDSGRVNVYDVEIVVKRVLSVKSQNRGEPS